MIFDGPNRLIILEAADGDAVAVTDIYDAWKDWVFAGTGAPFPEAFTTIGGEPIGGGVFVGSYFFLNTTDGWLIRPREASHTLTLAGNLYPVGSGDPLFAGTLGVFSTQIRLVTSSLTQAISTADASAGDVATAVWAHGTAASLVAAVTLIRKITDNRLEVDIAGQRLVLFDDDGVTELRSWDLTTDGGEDVETSTGVQTKRGAGALVTS